MAGVAVAIGVVRGVADASVVGETSRVAVGVGCGVEVGGDWVGCGVEVLMGVSLSVGAISIFVGDGNIALALGSATIWVGEGEPVAVDRGVAVAQD